MKKEGLMKTSLFDLRGKIALVTGSSGGLGLVIARGLAQHGAKVVLNGRAREKLDGAVKLLRDEGFDASGYAFDITDSERTESGILSIEREVGPIDVLVNNAGVQKRAPILDMTEETWREIIDINLTGVFLMSKAVGKFMVERKRGKIINVCSLLSEAARPTIAPYTASKGGVKMLTKALAIEWAKFNVQVNGIGPGYFATEMNKALVENVEFDSWLKTRTPAGRWGDPEELVGAVVFLAGEASSFVTGQIIYVDGGMLAVL